MIVPQPGGLSFEEWSAVLSEQFAEYGLPEEHPTEGNWREWALRVRGVDALAEVPEPTFFEGWREWGERVVEALAPVDPT